MFSILTKKQFLILQSILLFSYKEISLLHHLTPALNNLKKTLNDACSLTMKAGPEMALPYFIVMREHEKNTDDILLY